MKKKSFLPISQLSSLIFEVLNACDDTQEEVRSGTFSMGFLHVGSADSDHFSSIPCPFWADGAAGTSPHCLDPTVLAQAWRNIRWRLL